jgi:two-component system OmpR family sensor kinase
MKEYLYRTKIQVLQQKFHNIDLRYLSEGELLDNYNSDSVETLNKLKDKNMSLAVIDKNGVQIAGINNVDYIQEEIHDGDIDNGESTEKDKKHKIITPMPVPVLSEDIYIGLLNEEGNLEKDYKIIKDENNNLQLVAWRKVGDMASPSGLLQLSTSIEDCRAILDREVYMHTSLSILILILGTILGRAIFNRTLKPLYNITDTVEGIGVEDLDKRLDEENGQLEIDRLAKSFNIMLERIESSFQKEQYIKDKMRRFVSDASHELRTPLTSIHGFVEVLLRGAAKNEDQLNLALNSILMESERLTKLVNDLLILTKLEQQPIVEIKSENINDLIEEIYHQLIILCENRVLQLELKDDLMVKINRNQIKQVIFNLTQNAVLHTDKQRGIIKIYTNIEKIDDENFAVLKITDNGTGISEEHITKIYDRFFRSESHRAREHGGYGLGLSIVKSIIDSNHGEIHVESKVGVGTTFSVYLKLVK